MVKRVRESSNGSSAGTASPQRSSTPATTPNSSPPSKAKPSDQPGNQTLGCISSPNDALAFFVQHAHRINIEREKRGMALVPPAIGLAAGPLSPWMDGFITWKASAGADADRHNRWLACFSGFPVETVLGTAPQLEQAQPKPTSHAPAPTSPPVTDSRQSSSPPEHEASQDGADGLKLEQGVAPGPTVNSHEPRKFESVVVEYISGPSNSSSGASDAARMLEGSDAGFAGIGRSSVELTVCALQSKAPGVGEKYSVQVKFAIECHQEQNFPFLTHAAARLDGRCMPITAHPHDPYDSDMTVSSQQNGRMTELTAGVSADGPTAGVSHSLPSTARSTEQTVPASARVRLSRAGIGSILLAAPPNIDPSTLDWFSSDCHFTDRYGLLG
ncbi:hypothetical protein ACM66B_006609 [Microbotryomycetes sp. NB124-2]